MPDIRSFFAKEGGAPPAKSPATPTPNKKDASAKRTRGKRKIVDDSDDEELVQENKKPSKNTSKIKTKSNEVKGVEISASDYFASTKSMLSQPENVPSAAKKTVPKFEAEVRTSPRVKKTAANATLEASKTSRTGPLKKSTTSYQKHTLHDDDAYMDDGDDAEDIFAADAGGRKRMHDEYVEESEEEFLSMPKCVASCKADDDEDEKPPASKGGKISKSLTTSKKCKSTYPEDKESEEHVKPRKKSVKPRAPRAKKAEEAAEPIEIKAILDQLPTVEAPDAPPKDPNFKFDWKTARSGAAHTGPPPNEGGLEIPEGEENCLAGKSFVFTGQLKTISRQESQDLVKKYGGKVTTAPSGKTDFVVLGDDAGPSKLRKIQELKITTIDEAGLYYLIKTMPANGGTGKGAETAKKKRQEEEKKIRDQAVEIEKAEKARLAEAEKARIAAASRGFAVKPESQPLSQLWTAKYAPTQLSHICGNKGNVEKMQKWLREWPKHKKYDFLRRGADGMGGYRAVIISGPPGIGKTTAAHLAAKLEGYDILESNASDTRSKRLVESGISDVVNNTSLLGFFAGDNKQVDSGMKKIVLIMDEVDGMSAGDRGGVGALAKFCKKTEVPLILICNDRRLPKMRPFDFVACDIKFARPTVDQVRSRIMTIAHREGLKLPPNVVNSLIEGSNKDIRQIINMLSTAKLDQATIDYGESQKMIKAWEKHVILKPWDICQKLLGSGLFNPASKATLNEKIELYFNDHEFSYLMIQENYLRAKPAGISTKAQNKREQREENLKTLELVDQAAESISDGDIVDRMIHGPQQHWSLMPTHAVFSTVRPSSFVSGQMIGSSFISWLGNNSKLGKLRRLLREIHSHMRMKSSGDHNEIRQQYLPMLWYQLVKRLEVEGKDCVENVIQLMDSYFLTRDDFDSIKELGVGPQSEEKIEIETQTKSSFTRSYNATSHPVPFMRAINAIAPKKMAREQPDLEEAIEEDDDAEAVEPAEDVGNDAELDLKNDKYIKQPKAKAARKGGAAKKSAKAAAGNDRDNDVNGFNAAKGKVKGRRRPKKL